MVRNNKNFKKAVKVTAVGSFAEGERGRYKPRQTSLRKANVRPRLKADNPEQKYETSNALTDLSCSKQTAG
jgi:hypothetical protein